MQVARQGHCRLNLSARCVRLRTESPRIRAHAAAILASVQAGTMMKRNEIHKRKFLEKPTAWRESEYAALRPSAEAIDQCFSEDIFDAEDERAEVEIIVNGMSHGLN